MVAICFDMDLAIPGSTPTTRAILPSFRLWASASEWTTDLRHDALAARSSDALGQVVFALNQSHLFRVDFVPFIAGGGQCLRLLRRLRRFPPPSSGWHV